MSVEDAIGGVIQDELVDDGGWACVKGDVVALVEGDAGFDTFDGEFLGVGAAESGDLFFDADGVADLDAGDGVALGVGELAEVDADVGEPWGGFGFEQVGGEVVDLGLFVEKAVGDLFGLDEVFGLAGEVFVDGFVAV